MRKTILALLLLAALMVACQKPVEKQTYTCEDGSVVASKELCPKPVEVAPTPPPSPPVVTENPAPVLTPEVAAIVNKSGKLKVLRFSYLDSTHPFQENIYYASRDRLKVKLATKVKFSPKDYYDTVYLDLKNKSAVAYCEDKGGEMCPNLNTPVAVIFEDYAILTPFQWLDKLEEGSLTPRTRLFEGRTGKEVTFTFQGKSGSMYLDNFFGFPLEVEFDGSKYSFKNVVVNEDNEKTLVYQAIVK